MAKLAFYTQTYCGEKYVRKAIESILNQTFEDFVYYISDDGSTDSTPEIIMEYANKDARIVPFLAKTNTCLTLYSESIYHIWDKSGAKYFSILDQDDEYAPDFAEKMIFAMEQEDAEIAICGSSLVDSSTGELRESRALNQNVVVDRKNQERLFPLLFPFYRTIWGKVYKINFLKTKNIEYKTNVNYGSDTLFCLNCFSEATQFLVLEESLHTYYMHGESMSYRFDPKRAEDDFILYQEGIHYLEKIQGMTPENIGFMLNVYFYAVMDNIRLICKSKLHSKQMIDNLYCIFKNEKFLNNLDHLRRLCEAEKDIDSTVYQTKIKFEQMLFSILKNVIAVNETCKQEIFDIASLFCPEIIDFFDVNNIKSIINLGEIGQEFLGRDFEKTYKMISEYYGKDCVVENKLIYNLKVYLSAILSKEQAFIEEYVEQNRRKTDVITKKRIEFIARLLETDKEKVNVEKPINQKISVDRIKNFDELMNFINNHSEEEIFKYAFQIFLINQKISKVDAVKKHTYLFNYFKENSFVGLFKSQFGNGALLMDSIHDIKTYTEEYRWLYQILEDEKSKNTLFYILMYRTFLDKKYFSLSQTEEIQYFDSNIIPRRENHVFVDCGAFTGDSATDFINYCAPDESYKKIYCYEPAPDNYVKVVENMSRYHDVECRNKGVFDENSQMRFTSHMADAANRVNPAGDKVVEIVNLDSDIKEPVTFIKMDIESAEPNALLGAKRHITEDKPMLAICVYHTVTDLLKIPQIIYEMNCNQKFYLRHHDLNTPEEIVFYALPKEVPLEAETVKEVVLNKEESSILLQQVEQLAELYETIGESIAYIQDKLKQDNPDEAFMMMSLLQEGLEQELSFVRFLQDRKK